MHSLVYMDLCLCEYACSNPFVPGGNTFIGICGAPFGCWDSAWWEENRAENESYVWGLWDRGTLTRPSHDRQRDWLENSRFRSGDTIGILVDMDKRRMTMYRLHVTFWGDTLRRNGESELGVMRGACIFLFT